MMNTSVETIIKFQACTGIEKSLLQKWSLAVEPYDLEAGFNFDAFNKILIKNDIEEYSGLLFNYFISQLEYFKSSLLRKNAYERFLAKIDEEKELHKELTDILQFLLSQKNGNMTSITFQKQRKSKPVENKKIIDFVIDKLIADFVEREYNLDTLTEEEAEVEIRNNPDLEWIINWKIEKDYCDSEGNRIYDDDFEDHSNYFNPETGECHDGNYIRNQMIMEYAESHVMQRDVDLEYLDRIISEGFGPKKKAGAPEKNQNRKSIAIALANLKRVDRFLKSNDDLTDIEQIPLTDIDRLFLYECLDFFSLIDKSNKSPKKKYIRSLLDQIKKPNNPELIKKLSIAKFSALKSQINSISPK